jgi:hypothetical protein
MDLNARTVRENSYPPRQCRLFQQYLNNPRIKNNFAEAVIRNGELLSPTI